MPVTLVPEDASTTLYSPEFFNKHLKPIIREYCKIIKEAGEIAVVHACGHLKGLTKIIKLKEIGMDCIESVSPPPTGNVNLHNFKKALPGVCVMGGIHANAWLFELEDFKKYVKELIIEIGFHKIKNLGRKFLTNRILSRYPVFTAVKATKRTVI